MNAIFDEDPDQLLPPTRWRKVILLEYLHPEFSTFHAIESVINPCLEYSAELGREIYACQQFFLVFPAPDSPHIGLSIPAAFWNGKWYITDKHSALVIKGCCLLTYEEYDAYYLEFKDQTFKVKQVRK